LGRSGLGRTVLVEGLKLTKIYVGNLSYRANEKDIRNAFLRFGEVASVNIVMDPDTGRSGGFAFVEMADPVEASAAIEGLNDREIVSRRVTVREAQPHEERPRGGQYGGGGGGGGRYGENRGGGGGGGGRYGGGGRDSGGGAGRRGYYSRDDR